MYWTGRASQEAFGDERLVPWRTAMPRLELLTPQQPTELAWCQLLTCQGLIELFRFMPEDATMAVGSESA